MKNESANTLTKRTRSLFNLKRKIIHLFSCNKSHNEKYFKNTNRNILPNYDVQMQNSLDEQFGNI